MDEWTEIRTLGPSPPRRSNHTAVIFGGKLFVYGGNDRRNTKLGDLHCYHIDRENWEECHPKGQMPGPRSHHASVLQGDFMYCYGGRLRDLTSSSELICLEMNELRWHFVGDYHQPGSSEAIRMTMTLDSEARKLAAKHQEETEEQDELDSSSGSKEAPIAAENSGESGWPEARDSHTLISGGIVLYLFGGNTTNKISRPALTRVQTLQTDGIGATDHHHHDDHAAGPPRNLGVSGATSGTGHGHHGHVDGHVVHGADGGRLLGSPPKLPSKEGPNYNAAKTTTVPANMDATGSRNDMWLYDSYWREIKCDPRPAPRHGHVCALEPGIGLLLLFGGADGLFRKMNDLWVFHTNEGSYRWEQVKTHGSVAPRVGHTGVIHGAVFIVFGGACDMNEAFSSDTNEMLILPNIHTLLDEEKGQGKLHERKEHKDATRGQKIHDHGHHGGHGHYGLGHSGHHKHDHKHDRHDDDGGSQLIEWKVLGGNAEGDSKHDPMDRGHHHIQKRDIQKTSQAGSLEDLLVKELCGPSPHAHYNSLYVPKKVFGGQSQKYSAGPVGVVSKVGPCPRDGHSAVIYDGQMFVFGGDRNCNKLNDMFIYRA